MTLRNRLDKLHFIVQDLELAHALAARASTDFAKRTMARHVLVRAKDFIEHSRQARRPIREAGYDDRRFHELKEIFAKQFVEYFQTTRDRLAAHVQDLEFVNRIEIWDDIEIVTSAFLFESAHEIYQHLMRLGIVDLRPYVSHPDLALLADIERAMAPEQAPPALRIGTDVLAATRPNTAAVVTMGPLHERAGQLLLIAEWLGIEMPLLSSVSEFTDVTRIVKARVVTDVVSFADCLVTKANDRGGHTPRGLLDLLADEGRPDSAIAVFARKFRFRAQLDQLRPIRNMVGGHLEIDEGVALADVLAHFDSLSFEVVARFYDRAHRAFIATCRGDADLNIHVISGTALAGVSVSPLGGEPQTFDTARPELVPAIQPVSDWSGRATFNTMLEHWITGDAQRGAARDWFYQAFMNSDIAENVVDDAVLRSGQSVKTTTLRVAHVYLLEALLAERDRSRIERIVRLILASRTGSPKALAEVLRRYRAQRDDAARGHFAEDAVIRYMGALAEWSQAATVRRQIELDARSPMITERREAVVALFRMFILAAETARNREREPEVSAAEAFLDRLADLPDDQRLLGLIECASLLAEERMIGRSQRCEREYTELQRQIRRELGRCPDPRRSEELEARLVDGDYPGVILALTSPPAVISRELRRLLLEAISVGLIVCGRTPRAEFNYATALFYANMRQQAVEIARSIVERHPHVPYFELMLLRFEASSGVPRADVLARLTELTRAYDLTVSETANADDLRRRLEGSCSAFSRLRAAIAAIPRGVRRARSETSRWKR